MVLYDKVAPVLRAAVVLLLGTLFLIGGQTGRVTPILARGALRAVIAIGRVIDKAISFTEPPAANSRQHQSAVSSVHSVRRRRPAKQSRTVPPTTRATRTAEATPKLSAKKQRQIEDALLTLDTIFPPSS